MNRSLISLAALSLLSLTMAGAWAAKEAPAVQTVMARAQGGVAQEISLDGVVEAVRQASLSTQVAGAIVRLNVKAGDRVRAGQELLSVDASAAQQQVVGSSAQLEAAQANFRVAGKALERQQLLFQKQYISQAALDQVQAQWEAAQAQVQAQQAQTQAARSQTGFFSVRAPFAALVSEVHVSLGDMAMPGRPLVTLHDPQALRVSAAVPQSLIEGVRRQLSAVRYEISGWGASPGTTASTAKPSLAASAQLLPAVDPVSHTAQLQLALPTGTSGLVPGLFARVWVPVPQGAAGTRGQVFVPLSAIVRRAEMTGVYVMDAQAKPRLRQVRVGRTAGAEVEILSGVSAGDAVVIAPASLGTPR